jgi:hypothetical protein
MSLTQHRSANAEVDDCETPPSDALAIEGVTALTGLSPPITLELTRTNHFSTRIQLYP